MPRLTTEWLEGANSGIPQHADHAPFMMPGYRAVAVRLADGLLTRNSAASIMDVVSKLPSRLPADIRSAAPGEGMSSPGHGRTC